MRKFIALIVVVVIVAGGWTAGWFYGAGEIDRTFATLAAADGETAAQLTCGTQEVTGFPFRFDVTCEEATLKDGDLTATIGGVKASLLVYNPTQAKFSARSPITLNDAFSGAQSRIAFTGAEGSAQMIARDLWAGLTQAAGWRVGRISVVADGVEWTDTVVGEVPVMSTSHVEAHLIDIPERHDAAASAAALASFVSLADVAAPAYGIADGQASLEAELTGLPDDLRALGEPDVLKRWQSAGGQLKLVSLNGTAGEEFIHGTGTMGLDSGGRLDGQVELRSKGLVERLGGLLPEDWKGLIVGNPAEDGSYSQVLTVKAGVIFSGLMPITMVPPLM